MHIYHVASGTPVVTILRPARTPKGTEARTVIKHVTKCLRRHWPNTRIVWRGDSHYGRVEAMDWAEDNDTDYIFGLAGNAVLDALAAEAGRQPALPSCDQHAKRNCAPLRASCTGQQLVSAAQSGGSARVLAATGPRRTGMRQEVDIRYVVTSLEGTAQHLYEDVYCQRGQMVG